MLLKDGFLTFNNNCVLKKGSMFGEQALIYKKRRGAHCIVVSDTCDLCVMKGKDFNKIFGPLQLKEEERKKHFLENEIITDPDMRSLARIIGVNSTKKHYYKRMVLFNKGDRPDKLYLVYQGQVLIWDDDLQGEDAHNEGGMFEGETNSKRKTKKGLLKLPIRVQVKKQLDLMISGRGKMIGEEEIFTGKRRRYNASIESESIIYEIEYERMLNVCSDNHFIRNILRQKIKNKTLIVGKIIEQKKRWKW